MFAWSLALAQIFIQAPAFATADHWFLQLYLGIGEFSPTEPAQTPLPLDIVPIENDNHPLFTHAIALEGFCMTTELQSNFALRFYSQRGCTRGGLRSEELQCNCT